MSTGKRRRMDAYDRAPFDRADVHSEGASMEEMKLKIEEQQRRIQTLERALALIRNQQ